MPMHCLICRGACNCPPHPTPCSGAGLMGCRLSPTAESGQLPPNPASPHAARHLHLTNPHISKIMLPLAHYSQDTLLKGTTTWYSCRLSFSSIALTAHLARHRFTLEVAWQLCGVAAAQLPHVTFQYQLPAGRGSASRLWGGPAALPAQPAALAKAGPPAAPARLHRARGGCWRHRPVSVQPLHARLPGRVRPRHNPCPRQPIHGGQCCCAALFAS